DSVYNAKMMMLSDAQANDVAAAAAKLAIGTTHDFASAQAAQADVSLMLATATNVLGGSASDLSDKFALLQSHYGFKSITDLSGALNHVLPSMKGVKSEAADTFAAMAVLSTSGYQAERIGIGMNEVIAKLTTGTAALRNLVIANKQGGPDLERTTERLAQMTAGMSALQRASYLKTLGFNLRDVQVMETLLDGVKKFAGARQDMLKSKGQTEILMKLRTEGADQQLAKMWNNLAILRETIGETLLPSFNSLILKINGALKAVTDFAEAHKPLVAFALKFAAIGAAVLMVGGGLLVVSGAVMGFISAWGAITAIPGIILALATPLGVVVAASALIALGAYEIYEHWAGIKTFFGGVWDSLKTEATEVGGWLLPALTGPFGLFIVGIQKFFPDIYNSGVALIENLAKGIGSAAMAPVKAVEGILHLIREHLPFSPAHVGPLKDLNRARIIETVAETIRPGPAVSAMRRVAQAMAIAATVTMPPAAAMAMPVMTPIVRAQQIAPRAPQMERFLSQQLIAPKMERLNTLQLAQDFRLPDFGALDRTFAAARPLEIPGGDGALKAALALAHEADTPREIKSLPLRRGPMPEPMSTAAPVITINMPITVEGNLDDSEDFKRKLEAHGRELAETLNRELERHRRTNF